MTQIDPRLWQEQEGLPALLDALGAQDGAIRLVGGFVRDGLLGIPTADIDCATRLAPEAVIAGIRRAGFKAVPTGLAHGTVTAVLPTGHVEITTLRKDVSTNGRHATIAYTDDWREDAARRDFTINALSVDPLSGDIHDYFGGLEDLEAGRVRFIGDPLTRIAEDHLRILRFFRFHARFGRGEADAPALSACTARANDLMALSRERIADEVLKILSLPDPSPTIALMQAQGIFRPVLPEIDAEAPTRLARLVVAEAGARIAPDALRRLASLFPDDAPLRQSVGARLKLSNAARKRLQTSAGSATPAEARSLAYRIGREGALDRLLLANHAAAAAELADWPVPRLPVSGGTLVARGVQAGPAVATLLRQIEDKWIAENFPATDRVAAIVDEVMASR